MPKKVRELNATEVRRLTHSVSKGGKPYNALHPVGGISGLLLQVTPTGAKSWILRTTMAGKRRNIGLGAFPDVTLAQARRKARQTRRKIDAGMDPLEERKAARRAHTANRLGSVTFADAMRGYIKSNSKKFLSPRQAQQWQVSLTTYAIPHLGALPVSQIDLPHIKLGLDPIWETKTDAANRVREEIENILEWCATQGVRSGTSHTGWQRQLDEMYPSPESIGITILPSAMPANDIPGFMENLQKRTDTAARALEFLILTASRTMEVIGDKRNGKPGITWQEIDFAHKVWTVPADRMESGKPHCVPLTDAAVALLTSIGQGPPGAMVFPDPNGEIPSSNFLIALLVRMNHSVTAQGFRCTFKEWAREFTTYADEVSELALAHVTSDVQRAGSERIDECRLLMIDWERHCYDGNPSKTAGAFLMADSV
ncbi:tyrosine-type recombinase/integrase [Marinobacter caseinilyticus]|uniref:tyrosine-type recombinase/integrase n=1 Tax=Marinobacter caseinilyticus TaxID=2692195 RepID=UPI0014084C08|nr:integrase family protein [Marinobacter caseinilyticus]